MSTNVLGISAFYHDSAAAIAVDGKIVAAAQEERFTRKKHDSRFPYEAVDFCLEYAFLDPTELTAVVFYDDPVLTFDRALKSILNSPRGEDRWMEIAPSLLGVKLGFVDFIRSVLGADVPVTFARHHHSHAASAFYPSPFTDAAILTLDGVGEWATTSIAVGHDTKIENLVEIRYPHSLGLLYSAFTSFTGFKVNSGEYKLMGLAPYGVPRYADTIREHLIDVRPDGSFRLDMQYFDYTDGDRMTNDAFASLFDGAAREPESQITRREMDLAASIQVVTEEVVLGLARHAAELTGARHLCMAGGVALNCVANGIVLRSGIFEDIWIQPAAGDAGGAIGAALAASHERFGVPRAVPAPGSDGQEGSYLGPVYTRGEIEDTLDEAGAVYDVVPDSEARAELVADALARGEVVGHFAGRAEFGPRALGSRSILGDPRRAETQVDMNLKIKYRESFRPFAPAVLREHTSDYFDLDRDSPYMLLVAPVREDRRVPTPGPAERTTDDMRQIVAEERSDIPAVTHIDYSARVQTVDARTNPRFHEILRAFEERTQCGVVVNTSFNVRGEPIVGSPEDAYRCFMRTGMDMLVIEEFVLRKPDQPVFHEEGDWRDEYELD